MSRYSQIIFLCVQTSLIFLILCTAQGTALPIAPLPDQATASYHPGLFGNNSSDQGIVPPVENISEAKEDTYADRSEAVHFSFFPGDAEKGERASVAGYISGISMSTPVNISGRADKTEQFRYLNTVQSDNQGIFVWSLPEWASNITMVMVEIAR